MGGGGTHGGSDHGGGTHAGSGDGGAPAGRPGGLLIPFRGYTPVVHPTAFVAPTAVLVGNVTVGAESSVWFGAVLRGDDPDHGIVVGPRTSVQDNCVVHVGAWAPTIIGADCTIGHGAKFESCTIGDRTVVGMNAVILQKAVIGEECLIAAGSIVLEGAEIPARSVVAGVPAKVKKTLEGSAAEWIEGGGAHYVALSRAYLEAGIGRPGRDPADGGGSPAAVDSEGDGGNRAAGASEGDGG